MERFAWLSFRSFHGFQQYHENFSVNIYLYTVYIQALYNGIVKYFKHKAHKSFSVKNFIGWNPLEFSSVNLSTFVTKVVKRDLIRASNFLSLRICMCINVKSTALKFSSRTFLSLYLYIGLKLSA